MRTSMFAGAAALLACLCSNAVAQSIDPIVIKGSKFFYKTNGTQFYIKGVAYQQDVVTSGGSGNSFSDPLADPAGCSRDIPYLQQLNTNTIRVYAVDPTADHSQCMSMLAAAGIYTLIDLGSPNTSITSNQPSWTTSLFARYQAVVDEFQKYDNVLGFFSGNEVASMPNVTASAAFVKAATRDTKAYIKNKGYRAIGVGYATDDNEYVRVPLADYMNCGDASTSVDFWGYNIYSWCGQSTFEDSGYEARTQQFSTYNVPAFFAEYGCNLTQPRIFQDTPVIYGPRMDDVWSGAIVYLYFNDAGNYGLVSVQSGSTSVSKLPDFTSLSSQIATVSPSSTQMSSYTPTNSAQSCPSPNANFSAVASPLPPTPDATLCNCMYQSVSCAPNKNVNASLYGELFNYVCGLQGKNYCQEITANGSTGSYGKYSFCSPVQQLGYVLNQYYSDNGASASACSFGGSAVIKSATPTQSCNTAATTGTSPTGTSATGSGTKGAANINTVFGARDGGIAAFAVLVPVAVISAIGMLAL